MTSETTSETTREEHARWRALCAAIIAAEGDAGNIAAALKHPATGCDCDCGGCAAIRAIKAWGVSWARLSREILPEAR